MISNWLASVNDPSEKEFYIVLTSFYIQLKPTGLQNNLTFNQGTDLWFWGGERRWEGLGGGGVWKIVRNLWNDFRNEKHKDIPSNFNCH